MRGTRSCCSATCATRLLRSLHRCRCSCRASAACSRTRAAPATARRRGPYIRPSATGPCLMRWLPVARSTCRYDLTPPVPTPKWSTSSRQPIGRSTSRWPPTAEHCSWPWRITIVATSCRRSAAPLPLRVIRRRTIIGQTQKCPWWPAANTCGNSQRLWNRWRRLGFPLT